MPNNGIKKGNIPLNIVPQRRDQPTLLVNAGINDPTRGDVAGWRGLARAISKKIGGRVVYADDTLVRASFPDALPNDDYQTLLHKFLDGYSPPEYILGEQCSKTMMFMGHNAEDSYIITGVNEHISNSLLKEQILVSHNLTQDILHDEGGIFDQKHPTITRPIIAVFLVNPSNEKVQKEFSEKLVALMAHYPESTIYLCGSRRTRVENHTSLLNALRLEVEKTDQADNIDVLSYQFSKDAEYNPYKGLIARAQHFVIWGDSQSMLSEALYSGKTVYAHRFGRAEDLEGQGYVHQFNELATNTPPFSKEFKPINLTDQIADIFIERQKIAQKIARSKLQDTLEIQDEKWLDALNQIRLNFHNAADLDDEYKNNAEFVKLALQLRGYSLQHFPKFQDDTESIVTAFTQNIGAFTFANTARQEEQPLALKAAKVDWRVVKHLAAPLKRDDEIAYTALEQHGEVLLDLDKKYLSDPKAILLAIVEYPELLDEIDQSLLSDRAFILAAVRVNYQALAYADTKFRKDREIALIAAKASISSFHDFDDAFREDRAFMLEVVNVNGPALGQAKGDLLGDEEIVLCAIEQYSRAFQYANDELKNNKDFAVKAIKTDALSYRYIGDDLKNDAELAMLAIKGGLSDAIQFMSKDLRDNIDLMLELAKTQYIGLQRLGPKAANHSALILACLKHGVEDFYRVGAEPKKNAEVVLAAMKIYGLAIREADNDLLKNRDFALAAVRIQGEALRYLDIKFLQDREIVLEAVKQNLGAYSCLFEKRLPRSKTAAFFDSLKSLWQSVSAAPIINMRADPEIALEAIKHDPDAIVMVDASLKENHEFMLEAMQIDIEVLRYADVVTQDVKFMRAALEIDKEAESYMNDKTKKRLSAFNPSQKDARTQTPPS
tara:strand:+ start:29434 stop:32109 length:2676 start_codon:yes stop_codon:yes gene_type:complete